MPKLFLNFVWTTQLVRLGSIVWVKSDRLIEIPHFSRMAEPLHMELRQCDVCGVALSTHLVWSGCDPSDAQTFLVERPKSTIKLCWKKCRKTFVLNTLCWFPTASIQTIAIVESVQWAQNWRFFSIFWYSFTVDFGLSTRNGLASDLGNAATSN